MPALETYAQRAQRATAFQQGLALVQPLIVVLSRNMARRNELAAWHEYIRLPANLERIQREQRGFILCCLWAVILGISWPFDAMFTFASAAAFLREGLQSSFQWASHSVIAFSLAAVVIAITVTIKVVTESARERERLHNMPAEDSGIPEIENTIRRHQRFRRGWAVMLGIVLLAAAGTEIGKVVAYHDISDGTSVSKVTSWAAILGLVTPYVLTYVVHVLLLFLLPLPTFSFLSHLCAPDRIERNLRRADEAIHETARRIYETIIAVPDPMARSRLVGVLTEAERSAVNQAMGREVLQASPGATPQGRPSGTVVPPGDGNANTEAEAANRRVTTNLNDVI